MSLPADVAPVPPRRVDELRLRSRRRAVELRRRRRILVAAPAGAAASVVALLVVAVLPADSDDEHTLRVVSPVESVDAADPSPAPTSDAGVVLVPEPGTGRARQPAPASLPSAPPGDAAGQRADRVPGGAADGPDGASAPPDEVVRVERYDAPAGSRGFTGPDGGTAGARECGAERSPGCVGHDRPPGVRGVHIQIQDEGPWWVPPSIHFVVYQLDSQGRRVAAEDFCDSGTVALLPETVYVGVTIFAEGCAGPATRGQVVFTYHR